jgi:hypothetical protein
VIENGHAGFGRGTLEKGRKAPRPRPTSAVWDPEWGPAFWKTNAYAPYPIWLWLNGHSWAKRQLEKAGIHVSGSGSYRAEGLRSQDVAITVSGAGGAVVHAERTLDAHISGSGSVEYIGNPLLTKQLSGSGSIRQR